MGENRREGVGAHDCRGRATIGVQLDIAECAVKPNGLTILLVGSLLAAAMPVFHMMGAGVGVRRTAGAYFFVWTLYALGMSGMFGFILSVRGLWSARAARA